MKHTFTLFNVVASEAEVVAEVKFQFTSIRKVEVKKTPVDMENNVLTVSYESNIYHVGDVRKAVEGYLKKMEEDLS